MRLFCLITLLLAFAVPTAATAAGSAAGDGSLAVSDANGTVVVRGTGSLIFGQFDQGTLTVVDYRPDDPTAVMSVTGAKLKYSDGLRVYSGSNVRFLLPSGRYTIQLVATGIDASAVGRGSIGTIPQGTPDDGTFAVNGGKPQPLVKGADGEPFGGR